ncbi:radical SAM/SPASM domain-containing protein [Candidatus Termititenax aidoneus]|uniref:Radical SAM/SPASM domain-containing protein n=1 Tax=Termititenax aidoneus TaxID=2218524 RepID=A0A388TB28_TERA1|nr:radical SAM/SPASM domain-containing protein [Candidatus Termititenax aidoneus]
MRKLSFRRELVKAELTEQLSQDKLLGALYPFFDDNNFDAILKSIQESVEIKISIGELKKLIMYKAETDKYLVNEQEMKSLIDILKANSNDISLRMPYLIKVNKDNFLKILRVDKYYNDSSYMFKKMPSKYIRDNLEFVLPFQHTALLLAMCQVLADEQIVKIAVLSDLDALIKVKAMLAINKKVKENPKIQPDSATLIMSEECNLRCVYCYEPHQKRDKTVMTFETAKQVLRKFDRDCKITFFGGEPMLNIELMKQICEWGWEYRNFSFEMITNGQVIDREFFRNYVKYFKYVQLSLDGPRAANDLNRGHGSFQRGMEFYNVFQEETGWAPTIHPVLSKYSVPYLLDMVKWFYNIEKMRDTKLPLRWLPGDSSTWTEEDFGVYAEQLVLLKKWYLENDIRQSHFAVLAFSLAEEKLLNIKQDGTWHNEPRYNESHFCSAGRTLMAVLPSGKMVPCHHEYWCAPEDRIYSELDINEDSPGINHMSEMCMRDIPKCNACPQWGCCVCPGSFYLHGKTYTEPDQNWCRAGKMLIEVAKNYVEELAEKLNNSNHKTEYLTAGVDYLLQKEVDKIKGEH